MRGEAVSDHLLIRATHQRSDIPGTVWEPAHEEAALSPGTGPTHAERTSQVFQGPVLCNPA